VTCDTYLTHTYPIGMLMRFIPVREDPDSFFDNSRIFIHDDTHDIHDANLKSSPAAEVTGASKQEV
jgi:hypothetical protein